MTRSMVVLVLLAPAALPAQQTTVWDSVGRVLQTSAVTAGAYRRYTFPRRDLTVRVGDLALSPRIALIGWAGFTVNKVISSPAWRNVSIETRESFPPPTRTSARLGREISAATLPLPFPESSKNL